mmetsp:Transcript_56137/g.114784  ORF Transcript_56137/g.114784 Transcript_56137/m.114784 type:complete len:321 (-) Transcript_56137:79-1041(-)
MSSGTNHNMNHIVKRIETRVLAPPGGFTSFSLGGAADPYENHKAYAKSNLSKPKLDDSGYSYGSSRAPAPSNNSGYSSNYNNNNNGYSDEKENDRRYGRERRDSLDELVQSSKQSGRGGGGGGAGGGAGGGGGYAIPGLEGHMSGRNNSSAEDGNHRRMRNQQEEYAAGPAPCNQNMSHVSRSNAEGSFARSNQQGGRASARMEGSAYAEILKQQIAYKKQLDQEQEAKYGGGLNSSRNNNSNSNQDYNNYSNNNYNANDYDLPRGSRARGGASGGSNNNSYQGQGTSLIIGGNGNHERGVTNRRRGESTDNEAYSIGWA